jgi:perosamine synthetase
MINVAKPLIGPEEIEAVTRVMSGGGLAQGPEVAAFEREFSNVVSGRECIAVNSGTSALHLGLLAHNIGVGDEVIVPSFTFAATANSVRLTGATPVFADIELDTYCIDPLHIETLITSRTKAIMAVHLYGQAADISALQKLAKRHDLLFFEDAAQAHLAEFNGEPVGAFGAFAAFSFYPTKNMTAGEGGMIVTADKNAERTSRLLRNQGMEKRYENELVGFNNRMTDIHAAIGRVQLRKLSEWTQQRKENAKCYNENLVGVVTPSVRELNSHVYHQYTIRVTNGSRDRFSEELEKRGVGNGVYYPIPVHKLPSFDLQANLPNTEIACQTVLSIPVHPALTQSELETVVHHVNSVASMNLR